MNIVKVTSRTTNKCQKLYAKLEIGSIIPLNKTSRYLEIINQILQETE